jgi:hypothetical protein
MKLFILLFVALLSTVFAAPVVMQSQSTVYSQTTSYLALPANTSRKALVIHNLGPEDVFINYNSAHTGQNGIFIPKFTTYEPLNTPLNSVYSLSTATYSYLSVYEGL